MDIGSIRPVSFGELTHVVKAATSQIMLLFVHPQQRRLFRTTMKRETGKFCRRLSVKLNYTHLSD